MKDSKNPAFMFGQTDVELLAAIVRGELDVRRLAAEQLASRGLDLDGKWVGFDRAREIAMRALEVELEPRAFVEHDGRTYSWTGKTGTRSRTCERVAEYAHRDRKLGREYRVWARFDGTQIEED